MAFVIVPDYIYDGITALLDRALADYPAAEPDREYLRSVLVNYVDQHGKLPDSFELRPKQ